MLKGIALPVGKIRRAMPGFRHRRAPPKSLEGRHPPMSEDYWRAFYAACLRMHAATWSWSSMRLVCKCGKPIPCPHRKAIMGQAMGLRRGTEPGS